MEFFESIDAQQWLIVGLVIVGIWAVQRVIAWILIRSLTKVTNFTQVGWDDEIAAFVRQPLRYVAIAIGLIVSAEIIEADESIIAFIDNLARSLIIIAIFVALFKAVDLVALSRTRMRRFTGVAIDEQLLPFLRTATKIVIIALAVLFVFQEWDYNVSGLIAGLGLGGLAFSLAAQDTVANLFGFTTIVGDRPLVVGEFIETPDVSGVVEKVGIRSTHVRQLSQGLAIIPNSTLARSVITNWSRLQKRWIDLTIGLTYSTTAREMATAVQRIEEMLKSREKVQADTVQVIFTDFSDSSIDILIRAYVSLTDWYEWMKEKEAVNLEIMNILEDMGLSMAFPSRALYFENLPKQMRLERDGDNMPVTIQLTEGTNNDNT